MSNALNAKQYRHWLEKHVTLASPFAPEALRNLVLNLFLGRNYRILTEKSTEQKLFITYTWLTKLHRRYRRKYGNLWQSKLLDELLAARKPTKEEKDLMFWLLGLTHKTAVNLEIARDKFPNFLAEMIEHCRTLFKSMRTRSSVSVDQAWLLLMAGAATLNIRGSEKARAGKALEKVFLKIALEVLGLKHEVNFWLNVGRDIEVDRESDAEVQTKRGRIRMDIALISSGNQEVIEDKINRVGENGVVIFDKIGARSRVYETANRRRVSLIQIRHNQPLTALRNHLEPLVSIPLKQPPSDEEGLKRLIARLPFELFELRS